MLKDGTKIFKRVCRSSRLLLQFHAGKSTFILHFPTFNNWPSFHFFSSFQVRHPFTRLVSAFRDRVESCRMEVWLESDSFVNFDFTGSCTQGSFLSLSHPPLYHVLTLWILRPSGTQGWGRWCTSMGARSATWEWTLARLIFAEAFKTWTMPPLLSAGERWGQAVGNGKRGGGSHFPSVCPGGKKLFWRNLNWT